MTLADFSKAYGKSAGLLIGSAAVSYFLTFHSTLSPPLKPRQVIFGMSVLVELYCILYVFNSITPRPPPLRLLIFSVLLYFVSLFSLTFLIPTSDSSYREAMGFVCKPEFLALYGPSCYWIDPETLAKASFEPDRIWEYWSIEVVRAFLCAGWLFLIWSIVTSIAVSVRRPEVAAKGKAKTKG